MYEMSSTLYCLTINDRQALLWLLLENGVKRRESVCSKEADYCSALQAKLPGFTQQREAEKENKLDTRPIRICISNTSHAHYVRMCDEIRDSYQYDKKNGKVALCLYLDGAMSQETFQ